MQGETGCDIRPVSEESIALAARLIRQGELVVIPTDTVYGVACDPTNEKAIEKLFRAKHRPREKSVQVLLASLKGIGRFGLSLPAPLDALADRFCPGGFSPICVAGPTCPFATARAGSDERSPNTQGIRIPSSNDALRVLAKTGPLATSSANLSGGRSASTVEEATVLGSEVALYLDGGATPGAVASTVVAADPLAEDGIVVLREGIVPAEEIRRALRDGARRERN